MCLPSSLTTLAASSTSSNLYPISTRVLTAASRDKLLSLESGKGSINLNNDDLCIYQVDWMFHSILSLAIQILHVKLTMAVCWKFCSNFFCHHLKRYLKCNIYCIKFDLISEYFLIKHYLREILSLLDFYSIHTDYLFKLRL